MENLPPLDLEAVKRCLKAGCSLQTCGEQVIVCNDLGDAAGEITTGVFDELRDGGIIEREEREPYDVHWVQAAKEVASA